MLDSTILKPGEEQFETFYPHRGSKCFYQYDYRDLDGELFSTVKTTLEFCREAKDVWLNRKMMGGEDE